MSAAITKNILKKISLKYHEKEKLLDLPEEGEEGGKKISDERR